MSMFDLTGKVAVVTGATKGIGRGIAEAIVQQGGRVVVSSRDAPLCDTVAADLNAEYGKGDQVARGLAFDLNDREQIETYVADAAASWGGVDILVCNAAILPYIGPSAQTPPELFDRILLGNVHHNFRLAQALRGAIAKRGGGAIVFIGSEAGLSSSPLVLAYAAAKAAVAHMAVCLADEMAEERIRVNCVAPGLIRSASSSATFGEAGFKSAAAAQPLGKVGEPEDIAGAVVYLASAAGAHVTGQILLVDGGRSRLSPRRHDATLAAAGGTSYN